MIRIPATLVAVIVLAACAAPASPDLGSAESAIIGGAAESGYPAVGALRLGSGWNSGICSGTLITPRIVLTAAHCVDGITPSAFVLGPNWDSGQALSIKAWERHPQWDPDYPEMHFGQIINIGRHDVGIVVLKNPAPVEPMAFRVDSLDGLDGMFVTYVGYGKSTTNQYADDIGVKNKVVLQMAQVWEQGYVNFVAENQPVRNTCGGDSGGPGFMKLAGVEQIVGLVSSGDEDCKVMGYSIRVDKNVEWITQMIQKHDPAWKPASCGDGTCGPSETIALCEADCVPKIVCGDGKCEGNETYLDCGQDCPAPYQPTCGDTKCEAGEEACTQDCGGVTIWAACSGSNACQGGLLCVGAGDGNHCTERCTDTLTQTGCPDGFACFAMSNDEGVCGPSGTTCGDGMCGTGETADTCAADCGRGCEGIPAAGCCDGERVTWCGNDGLRRQWDCGANGTPSCGWGGDRYDCGTAGEADPDGVFPRECGLPGCGDTVCGEGEDCTTCPSDCGGCVEADVLDPEAGGGAGGCAAGAAMPGAWMMLAGFGLLIRRRGRGTAAGSEDPALQQAMRL